MATVLPLWDHVGRCYDILQVDPFQSETGIKRQMVIAVQPPDPNAGAVASIVTGITSDIPPDPSAAAPEKPASSADSDFDLTPDAQFEKPKCMDYAPRTGGNIDATSASLLSSYDFMQYVQNSGSLKVSDPTGSAFAASLSASFTSNKQSTGSQKTAVSLTLFSVNCYSLGLKDDPSKITLNPDFVDAVNAIPGDDGDWDAQAFIAKWGTHYASEGIFGGLAYQRITMSESDYSSFLEENVDISAAATETFELAKVEGSASHGSKRSQKFGSAQETKVEQMKFTGGGAQDSFSFWAMNICQAPGLVQAVFRPLYELVTSDYFADDGLLQARQSRLSDAVNAYLAHNGTDTKLDCLKYGDEVQLMLASSGNRYLELGQSRVQTNPALPPDPAQQAAFAWTIELVKSKNGNTDGIVRAGDVVALCSKANGQFLDAQSGSDAIYHPGKGLVGVDRSDSSRASAQWQIGLAGASRPRTELVNGDFIKLQSQWLNPHGKFGCAFGELDPNDPDQRVYSFGDPASSKGTIWRIARPG